MERLRRAVAGGAHPRRIGLVLVLCLYYQKEKTTHLGGLLFGGDNRTRTCDLMRVKHAL